MHIPSASPVLPVPEDPLAGVWGSLHLSFRIYVFMYLYILVFVYFCILERLWLIKWLCVAWFPNGGAAVRILVPNNEY